MRTLQIVPAMEQGGVERGVTEVNRILAAAGWENVVVSAGGRLAAQIEADGGRHVALDVKSKNPFTCLRRAAALGRIVDEVRPDAVCAHSRVPAWLFLIANRKRHIPWITFAHGANSPSPYSRVMTRGDLVVTPSRFLADFLKETYSTPEEKLRVIPRAIDATRFDPTTLDTDFIAEKRTEWGLDGHFVLMGMGRITQLKGYDTLIRATALLARDMPDIRTVIVGEAEARRAGVEAELRKLAEEPGAAGRIVFAGNQRKAAECLSMANLVASANSRKPEAFGRSMAEALAMNRPVAAAAFGGALDIVQDGVNGALVPMDALAGGQDRAAAAFADAVRRIRSMRFGDLRTPAMEKFSFARMAESTLAVYREVAGLG